MEVRYRQEFFFTGLYPVFPLLTLALRAMTITAAVIADAE
jgi:hypothetical protein